MCGALYWEENSWPVSTNINRYDVRHYEPKSENTSAQNVGQFRLLVGKYKKIKVVVNMNRFVAQKTPPKIENIVIQHVETRKRVKLVGHTWRRESAQGMENVNAVSKNKYSTRLPEYLSIRLGYTKFALMIPCPMKNIRDPTDGEKYC
jgi:hypothetical protein